MYEEQTIRKAKKKKKQNLNGVRNKAIPWYIIPWHQDNSWYKDSIASSNIRQILDKLKRYINYIWEMIMIGHISLKIENNSYRYSSEWIL